MCVQVFIHPLVVHEQSTMMSEALIIHVLGFWGFFLQWRTRILFLLKKSTKISTNQMSSKVMGHNYRKWFRSREAKHLNDDPYLCISIHTDMKGESQTRAEALDSWAWMTFWCGRSAHTYLWNIQFSLTADLCCADHACYLHCCYIHGFFQTAFNEFGRRPHPVWTVGFQLNRFHIGKPAAL